MLNGMSDSDCRNYAKIIDKSELRFGVGKQRELHQARRITGSKEKSKWMGKECN